MEYRKDRLGVFQKEYIMRRFIVLRKQEDGNTLDTLIKGFLLKAVIIGGITVYIITAVLELTN